jgi:hypothetical protein
MGLKVNYHQRQGTCGTQEKSQSNLAKKHMRQKIVESTTMQVVASNLPYINGETTTTQNIFPL